MKKIAETKLRQRLLSQTSSISHRLSDLASGEINDEARTVVLTFSSEAPVDRWFGREILDHSSRAVRLSRINRGGAFLLNHDRNQQIGVVVEATVEGRRGKALVKFSRNRLGEEAFQDVKDGIRTNVSVSYRYHELKLEEQKSEGADTYRVTDWEPLEISLEAVPADPTVGVGRGSHFEDINMLGGPHEESAAEPTREEVSVAAGAEDERKRALEIISLGDRFQKPDLARAALMEGLSVDEFSRKLLMAMESRPELPAAAPASARENVGLSRDESKKFSFLKAMRAALNNDWRGAEFEREVSEAAAAKFKRQTSGFLVPSDVIFASRFETTTAPGSAGSLVASNIPPGSFIEALRARLVIRQLGAKILSGLEGNVTLPRMAGGAKAFWVAETKDVEEQPFKTDQVPLSPKSVGAFTDISRRLILQSSIDVEEVVREDLATAVASAIDLAAIAGSGKDNQPRGILSTEGVANVPLTDFDFNAVVMLETAIAKANANFGSLAYLTNPRVSGMLKTTLVNENSSTFIWGSGSNGRGIVNGYPAEVSTIVPDNLNTDKSAMIFGNWADLVIGEWGVLDVQVNPYLKGTSGTVRIRVIQDVDIAIRHPESFAFYDTIKPPQGPVPSPDRARSRRGES